MKNIDDSSEMTSTFLEGRFDINILLAFAFGVIFLSIMLWFSIQFPNPTPFQLKVFMTALSSSAAGVGAVLPGFLHIEFKKVVRAGGALSLFVIVWFSQPVIERTVVTLERPTQSAESVVDSFFNKLDSGDISGTYMELDQVSRDTMVPSQELWVQLYKANIEGLGTVKVRKLMGLNAFESPSGIPVGIYQQYNYLTRYSNIFGCRQESILVRADREKQWRVYSYLISPQNMECSL